MRFRWWRWARCRVKHGRICPHLENHSGRPRPPRPRLEMEGLDLRPAAPRVRSDKAT